MNVLPILWALLIPGLLIAETAVENKEIPGDQWMYRNGDGALDRSTENNHGVYEVGESTSIVKTISASVTVGPAVGLEDKR